MPGLHWGRAGVTGMYNRYQGNSGKFVRMEDGPEQSALRPARPNPPAPPPLREPEPPRRPTPAAKPPLGGGMMEQIGRLLPKGIGSSLAELTIEDIILMLILYLMYRESGDSELLIIMGAMFLL